MASTVQMILVSTPIKYLQQASPRDVSIAGDLDDSGLISSVFTNFYVDHREPLAALQQFPNWFLSELSQAHLKATNYKYCI